MPETVYVVIRKGIYRHECCGVFTTLEKAKQVADRLCALEPDRRHGYQVLPHAIDHEPEFNCATWEGAVEEPKPVYENRSTNERKHPPRASS